MAPRVAAMLLVSHAVVVLLWQATTAGAQGFGGGIPFAPPMPFGFGSSSFPNPMSNLSSMCDKVECGKGKCSVLSNSTESRNSTGSSYSYSYSFNFTYGCTCEPGWNRSSQDPHYTYLPCIIPQCSYSSTCNQSFLSPPKLPTPPFSLTDNDPCNWAICGGGTCEKKSNFEYQCNCKPGYTNLLNTSSFPCYQQDCGFSDDCDKLGIGFLRTSVNNGGGDSRGGSSKVAITTPGKVMLSFMMGLALAVA